MQSRFFIFLAIIALLTGCKSWIAPIPLEQVDFKDRAQTLTKDGLTVMVSVPDRQQTEDIFGTSLYDSRIQPVWVEVQNDNSVPFMLIKAGMDRNYYSSLEAAWKRHTGDDTTRKRMDAFFFSMEFPNPIDPGETSSGFIFTNLDEGYKDVLIDLISSNDIVSMSFVIEVPGLVTDIGQRSSQNLYDEFTEIADEDELRLVLESLPSCTTNEEGDKNGDPLNIVMIGKADHLFSALIRSDWHATEVTYGASAWKTVKSFLFGARYRYSPISPLFVFGRSQELGLQRARNSIIARNHMRLWLMPYRYRGLPIWLGQISRDIGVKFSKRTIFTHAIDPDVDETRNSLIGDLAYSQSLAAVGFVKGSQRSTLKETYYNLTPDPYYSDGLRAVMFFEERPRALNEIKVLNWERPSRSKDRIEALEEYQAGQKKITNP
jgi:hypothetical protein